MVSIKTVEKYNSRILMTLGCNTSKDCLEVADTCTAGQCKCGKNDKCSYPGRCLLGECIGM